MSIVKPCETNWKTSYIFLHLRDISTFALLPITMKNDTEY